MTWCALARFLAGYLGIDESAVSWSHQGAMVLSNLVIRYEPELTPYVLQAVSEAY